MPIKDDSKAKVVKLNKNNQENTEFRCISSSGYFFLPNLQICFYVCNFMYAYNTSFGIYQGRVNFATDVYNKLGTDISKPISKPIIIKLCFFSF